jgi:hypothetical protein
MTERNRTTADAEKTLRQPLKQAAPDAAGRTSKVVA